MDGRGAERRGAAAGGAAASRAQRNGAGQPMIDLEFLRGLIEAVDRSGIDSLEIMRAGTRIRVSKTPPPAPLGAPVAAPSAAGVPASALPGAGVDLSGPLAAAAAVAPESPAIPAGTPLLEIKSPMVGTFFRAPAPEAPPYVEVGSHISKGQTLCILEAMKLMNELESEVEGVVREILVENAEPVEYGQVLFRIEPSS